MCDEFVEIGHVPPGGGPEERNVRTPAGSGLEEPVG